MIHVIAVVTAKPGKREEVLEHFRANVPAVRAEKGCIEYGAAIDADPALPVQTKYGPDAFVVVEKWESMDALSAHAVAPPHEGLRCENEGPAREPGDPHPLADLKNRGQSPISGRTNSP